jgi:hypothetical protein
VSVRLIASPFCQLAWVSPAALVDLTTHRVHRIEDAPYLVLHEIAKTFATTRTGGNGGHDPASGGDSDIGRQQQLLKGFNGINVYLFGTGSLSVGVPHDLIEPIDNVSFGATQAVAQAVK